MTVPLLVTAGLSVVLFLSGFLTLLAPVPFAYGAIRRGWGPALGGFVLAAGLLWLLYRWVDLPLLPFRSEKGALFGLLYFFYYAAIGFSLAGVVRRPTSLETGFSAALLAALVLSASALALATAGSGVDLFAAIQGGIDSLFLNLVELKNSSGLSGEELDFLKKTAPRLAAKVFHLLPGLAVAGTFVILSLNLFVLRRLVGDSLTRWTGFAEWRLPEFAIWIPIGAGAFFFVNLYLTKQPAVSSFFLNLFVVLWVIYLYQGLAVISHWAHRRLSPIVRMFAYLAVFLLFQPAAIVVTVLGLFDFWFDFRRLRKVA